MHDQPPDVVGHGSVGLRRRRLRTDAGRRRASGTALRGDVARPVVSRYAATDPGREHLGRNRLPCLVGKEAQAGRQRSWRGTRRCPRSRSPGPARPKMPAQRSLHAAPNTISNIFAKWISEDGGRGSYQGPARDRDGRAWLPLEGRLRRDAARQALALDTYRTIRMPLTFGCQGSPPLA